MKKEIIDELTTRIVDKDNLIKILKKANIEKDEIINNQASELVFAHKQIRNRELIIKKVKELVSE